MVTVEEGSMAVTEYASGQILVEVRGLTNRFGSHLVHDQLNLDILKEIGRAHV